MKLNLNLFKKKQLASPPNEQKVNHRLGRDPYIDWVIIVNLFVIITAVLIFVSFVVYRDMKTQLGKAPVDTGSRLVPIDEKALQSVLGDFVSREKERSAIRQGYSGAGDPSF